MAVVKLSVSIPASDLAFIDRYAAEHAVESRSQVMHRALLLLQATELGDAYETAWIEWEESGEGEVWESTIADGLR